ncbi:MAG TPA: LacI family DNA-binding transcriptional regulator [Bacillota bacterium]|nr:LacI family DNA-binding transcriptional regulator [Bacillota bacterium]
MSVTIKDVAVLAEVSTATVSHVINNTRFVSGDTAEKVWSAVRQLNYNTNSVAKSLRSKKTNTIGLLIPDISNYFFSQIAEVVQNTLKQNGYRLILGNSNEDISDEKAQVELFNHQCVDGLIMVTTAGDVAYLREAIGHRYPVVFIDRKPVNYEADSVLVQNFEGAHDAVSRLIGKGHRRIGFISGLQRLSTSEERLEGYRRALQDHGIPVDDALIGYGNSKFESGYELTRSLVKSAMATALFIGNNLMTVGAVDYLIKDGFSIPGDVAVIGFDDYNWAEICNPPLSVIKQPACEIARKAAELLLQRLEEPDRPCREIRMPVEIIVRSSF